MDKISIVSVLSDDLIAVVASLANTIWREHYTSIIGPAQVAYMLDKFQSQPAIAQQIKSEGFLYYLIQDANNSIHQEVQECVKEEKHTPQSPLLRGDLVSTSHLMQDASGTYVGYLGITVKSQELFLSKFYLLAEHRSKGYGRQAQEFLEELARAKGLGKIVLTVNKHNTNSIKAYQHLGFAIVDTPVTDIGNGFVMDDYRLEKVI